jgi:signal transduction histidine kinase
MSETEHRGFWPRLLKAAPFRLSAIYIFVFSIAVALAFLYVYWNTQIILARELDQSVQSELQVLTEQFERGGRDGLIEAVKERSNPAGNSLYIITDEQGRWLGGNLLRVSSALWDVLGRTQFYYRRIGTHGPEERKAYAAIVRLDGGLRLLVGRDIQDRSALQGVVKSAFLLGLGVIALVGLGGGLLVSRQILARIDAVATAARSIMNGNLSGRIPVSGGKDEFSRLSLSLNAMLNRIEDLMTGLKQVSDNIAHDLKTPLHRLRTRAETAVKHAKTPQELRDALNAVIEDSDGLIKTFDALLNIARLEAGSAISTTSTFNLCEAVQGVAELYEPLGDERGLQFTVACGPGVVIQGEKHLLTQAIANLIDNAIKYSGGDTSDDVSKRNHVDITVSDRGEFADITVADHGPGIPPEERERVLQRFVRLQPSRSIPGSGLGLSLVAAVARLHGGFITFEDNAPGLRAKLSIRKAAPVPLPAPTPSRESQERQAAA